MPRTSSPRPLGQRLDSPADTGRPIRVMIVDDSIVARTVLSRMLEERAFEVVATAGNAQQAIEVLSVHKVDIILLDVEMPGIDGITALPGILAASDGARVLIVSSACGEGAAASLKALALGAADTLLKPGAGAFAGRFAEVLADRLVRIGHSAPPDPPLVHAPQVAEPVAGCCPPGPIECLAIGASTGGIHALSAFFAALPRTFGAPILITQHLPAEFMPYFAAQLEDIAGRKASVAVDGARLRPGELLIAPGDAHLRLIRFRDGVRVRLDRTPSVSGCLPSVDPMFASVAEIFGAGATGVILSGMGRDGVIGAADIASAGGEVLAQDAASSVVWGMPGAVSAAGLASCVLPPARIAHRVGKPVPSGALSRNRPWR
jgi:two-component system, chemotaxis family, protein-glutamate methylesterase/glutaminase